MGLHGLASVTIGVPDVASTTAYYAEFGLTPQDAGWLSTSDGGKQLRLVESARRQLVEIVVRAQSHDDIDRIGAGLARLGIPVGTDPDGGELVALEPVLGTRVVVRALPPLAQAALTPAAFNGPGRPERSGRRADGVLREARVRPNRLG